MSLPLNQVIIGDCVKVMSEWPENSVDCFVTDPPYGLGFMGKEWDKALPPVKAFEQMIRVLKPGALAFIMSSPRQDVLWRMLSMLEGVGFQLKTSAMFWIYRTGFPKSYDVSKGIDHKLGLEQDIVGFKKLNPKDKKVYAPKSESSFTTGQIAKGFLAQKITAPVSDLAKQWDGWKSQTGLKPALECILMVNKPRSESTIIDNIIKWGTGGINVDACRIPFKNETDPRLESGKPREAGFQTEYIGGEQKDFQYISDQKGRFPANLLVSDGALDTGKITGVSGSAKLGKPHTRINEQKGFLSGGRPINNLSPNDFGDQSRFFDLDAWAEHNGFLDVAKPSRKERDFGLWKFNKKEVKRYGAGLGERGERGQGSDYVHNKNVHPTVKPVKLMAYLITLGCPPKGLVVDPFLGSGTTCISAKKLRRKWIGIEINPEYAKIAEARINITGPLDYFIDKSKGDKN